MEQETSKGWITWTIVGIVVVGLVIWGALYFGKKSTNTVVNPPVVPPAETPIAANALSVSDQYPGSIVYVASIDLSAGGYVVIHKNDAGAPGMIIGSKYFNAGNNLGQVDVSPKTVEGQFYYAMLHGDDGDKKFDPTKDLPLKNDLGDVIMVRFKATQILPEFKG